MRPRSRIRRFVPGALAVLTALAVTACAADPVEEARNRVVWDHGAARAQWNLQPLATSDDTRWFAQIASDRLGREAGCPNITPWHTSDAQLQEWYQGRATTFAENVQCIGGCLERAGELTPAWMGSAPHSANILNPNFTTMGVGLTCARGILWAVVQFRNG